MRILLVAATLPEIEPTIAKLRASADSEKENTLQFPGVTITVAITGVGPMATAYSLGHLLASELPFQLAIQAGIGGAIDPKLEIGEVVRVSSERFVDLGAEAADGTHLSLPQLGLQAPELEVLTPPFSANELPFGAVAGATVSRAHGSAASIERLRTRFPEVHLESMEGGAFFYACLSEGVPPLQLRSISNYVEVRNREAWDIPFALSTLNEALWSVLAAFINK